MSAMIMNVSARRNMADYQGEQLQVRDVELGILRRRSCRRSAMVKCRRCNAEGSYRKRYAD